MGQSLTDSKFFMNDSATGLNKWQNCLMSGFSAETNGESFDLKSSSNQKCLEIDEITSPVEFSHGPPKKNLSVKFQNSTRFIARASRLKRKKRKNLRKKLKKSGKRVSNIPKTVRKMSRLNADKNS